MMEIMEVNHASNMNEADVSGMVGVDSAIIDWAKCMLNGIRCLVDEGAIDVMIRKDIKHDGDVPLMAKVRGPLHDKDASMSIHVALRRLERDCLKWAEECVFSGMFITEKRIDVFRCRDVQTDNRVGLDGFAFIFHSLTGLQNKHSVIHLGKNLKTILKSGRSHD